MKDKTIHIDHGSGGLATKKLIEEVFLKRLSNKRLERLEDSAILDISSNQLAFTTDSFVVDPIFFTGGDIGSLSIHGSVNDLAMQGARPVALSLGLILEEGLLIDELERVAESIKDALLEAKVEVVTADTKVVQRGKADRIFINTSGVGIPYEPRLFLSSERVEEGDVIIVSGSIGDHGATILLERSGFKMDVSIGSDSCPLNGLVETVIKGVGEDFNKLKVFRDPTRGGLATVLNEIAQASNCNMILYEDDIPVKEEVRGVCEILGLDPLYLANEGKMVLICKESIKEKVLGLMKSHLYGRDSRIIGKVERNVKDESPIVTLKTTIGGERIVSILSGQPLPRIC